MPATITTDSVRDYLATIGRTPLLTAEQEHCLAVRVSAGQQAAEQLATVADPAVRRELARTVAEGQRAKDLMVRANLRLVVSIARRFPPTTSMSLLDSIQEGTLGLMRAIDRFDHTRGLKLSTYATWWIRQAIGRALTDQGRAIRLPGHISEAVQKLVKARRALTQDLGRPPLATELAAATGLPEHRIEHLLRLEPEPASLHSPIGADGNELGDFLPDPDPTPEVTAATTLTRTYIGTALATLTDRESQVLRLRYGLDDHEARTLADIGAELGVSRERARQIEAKALGKLRRPGCMRALTGLLD